MCWHTKISYRAKNSKKAEFTAWKSNRVDFWELNLSAEPDAIVKSSYLLQSTEWEKKCKFVNLLRNCRIYFCELLCLLESSGANNT